MIHEGRCGVALSTVRHTTDDAGERTFSQRYWRACGAARILFFCLVATPASWSKGRERGTAGAAPDRKSHTLKFWGIFFAPWEGCVWTLFWFRGRSHFP